MFYLPYLFSFITSQPRYQPEIVWSDQSWTHNLFRFYELLFWRRVGIRHEMSASAQRNNGKTIVTYKVHTFEAACALLEQYIRGYFKELKLVRVYVPKFASVNNLFQPSPFLFAIALDTSNQGNTTSTTFSYNYTCTGSNLGLVGSAAGGNVNTFTSMSFNSVSMATVGSLVTGNGNTLQATYLNAPATGTHNLTTTWGSSADLRTENASYSGVKQSGQPSATSTTTNFTSAASPFNQSITVADANSWVVWSFVVATAVTAGANTAVRQQELAAYGVGIADTNAAEPAGSLQMTLTYTAGTFTVGGVQMALSPFAAAVTTVSNLTILRAG